MTPSTSTDSAEALLDQGIALHSSNQHAAAQKAYERVLEIDPAHPDALHLLGVLMRQLEKFDRALELMQAAVAADPRAAEFQNDLGNLLITIGRTDDAIAPLESATAIDPSFAAPHFNLGMAHEVKGEVQAAMEAYRKATELDPSSFPACAALAKLHHNARNPLQAIEWFRKAVKFDPAYVYGFQTLAHLLLEDNLEECIECIQRVCELLPDSAASFNSLGNALLKAGRYDQAVVAQQRAVLLASDNATYHSQLGVALQAAARMQEAVESHAAAYRLNPNDPLVLNNFGIFYKNALQFDDARKFFNLAAQADPQSAEPNCNLGLIDHLAGRTEEAAIRFRTAAQRRPSNALMGSNFLYCLNYTRNARQDVLEEHVRWAQRHAQPLSEAGAGLGHGNDPNPTRRLRIGYISSDFRNHSVAHFFEPLLRSHDSGKFETYCYSNVPQHDAVTDRLRLMARRWRDIVALNDEQVARQIRDDKIDILIELSGHTGDHRLLVSARKPAPIQVTYIGYPNTTGLRSIDYRIVDAQTDPPDDADRFCVESLVRLPGCFLCYQPMDDAGPIAPLPALSQGHVTFGSFNNFAKVNSQVLELWARVLAATPGSRLVIKAKGLSDGLARRRLIETFTGLGIESDRLQLLPADATNTLHMNRYAMIDIALDTFPYNGTTTTCEAMWMGAAVITLAGETHASRVGCSLLNAVGLTELIAHSEQQYVEIATKLASDMPRLKMMREGMRRRLIESPLLDAATHARNIESAYRQMWTKWCAEQPARADAAEARVEKSHGAATQNRREQVDKLLDEAVAVHEAGDGAKAEAIYRKVLEIEPKHPDALHLLGVLMTQRRQPHRATVYLRAAIASDPTAAEFHNDLANVLNLLGRHGETAEVCRRAIELDPNLAMAQYNLGQSLEGLKQGNEAVDAYRAAIRLDPGFVDAIKALLTLIGPRTEYHDEAIAVCRRLIELCPTLAIAHNNLGILLMTTQPKEAIESFRRAVQLRPDLAEVYASMAMALDATGQVEQAVVAYRKSIELLPNQPGAYNNLAGILWREQRWDEAHEAIQSALRLAPDFSEAHGNLATFLKMEGKLEEAIASSAKAIELRPDNIVAHSNLIYTMLFSPDYDAEAIAAAHRRWDEMHGRPAVRLPDPPPIRVEPGRRLRIGYVSPDFRDHVVGRNILPLLREHDRARFEIFCYADVQKPDLMTSEFQRHCDAWRNILGQSNEQLVQLVRRDRIDILVDLALHMAGTRLAAFGYRPAPVQATFAGYPGSTGMQSVDFRLTDPYLDPPTHRSITPEEPIRLPHSFWCYDPAAMTFLEGEGIDVSPLPAGANGYITFGCFNNFCKVNEPVLALWARVMKAVPNSRLLMLVPGPARQRLIATLHSHGIESHRIDFLRGGPRGNYLALYAQIDIVLDTFPYNGHTTSLDALWMGVPFVTLVGNTIVGRAGLSQLTNLGMTELAAESEEQFVETAIALAHDLPRLKSLRGELRARMLASPLTNAKQFARGVEAAYLEMASRGSRRQSGQAMIAANAEFAASCARNGNIPAAIAAYRKCVEVEPNVGTHHRALARVLAADGQWDGAIASHETANRLTPPDAGSLTNLAACLISVMRLEEAREYLRQALELDPNHADALGNQAVLFERGGQALKAVNCYSKALARQPRNMPLHSFLLFCMNYPGLAVAEVFAEHVRWGQRHADPIRSSMPHNNDPNPTRTLRIGYISNDFRNHSVAHFIEPIVGEHDRRSFDVVCYANVPQPDAITARLREKASAWRDIVELSDEQIARQIRDDKIDILVELSGHAADHRLLVLARKPAPIQVTYIGYPNTLGIRAIDYRIVDALTDPPLHADRFCVESLVRLSGCFLCYRPPQDARPVAPLPALSRGCITFGSFNNLAKVNEEMLGIWSRVLAATPGSRLVIKSKGLADRQTRQWISERFADRGIDAARIDLLPAEPTIAAHLDRYSQIDIALDTFPYNGTTTTCEAMWMGVPVVTLVGQVHASRVGLSLLSAVGLAEFAAHSEQQYVDVAAALAADIPRLQSLRAGMRQRLVNSPLLDAGNFTRKLEQAYRKMWSTWCDDQSK